MLKRLLVLCLLLLSLMGVAEAKFETQWENIYDDGQTRYDIDAKHVYVQSWCNVSFSYVREYKNGQYTIYIARRSSSENEQVDSMLFSWTPYWKGPEIDRKYAYNDKGKEFKMRTGLGEYISMKHLSQYDRDKAKLEDWNVAAVLWLEDFVQFRTDQVLFYDYGQNGPVVPEWINKKTHVFT